MKKVVWAFIVIGSLLQADVITAKEAVEKTKKANTENYTAHKVSCDGVLSAISDKIVNEAALQLQNVNIRYCYEYEWTAMRFETSSYLMSGRCSPQTLMVQLVKAGYGVELQRDDKYSKYYTLLIKW